jgi:hypothetical protein
MLDEKALCGLQPRLHQAAMCGPDACVQMPSYTAAFAVLIQTFASIHYLTFLRVDIAL